MLIQTSSRWIQHFYIETRNSIPFYKLINLSAQIAQKVVINLLFPKSKTTSHSASFSKRLDSNVFETKDANKTVLKRNNLFIPGFSLVLLHLIAKCFFFESPPLVHGILNCLFSPSGQCCYKEKRDLLKIISFLKCFRP